MKPTSSHTTNFKHTRKEKDHLEILDRSEEPSKVEPFEKINEEDEEVYLPQEIERQLFINIEKYSEEVKDEMRYLLIELLKYPSTKQAVRHRSANRLGYNDLKHIKNKLTGQSSFTASHFHPDHCADCGLLVQEREIPTCSSVWEFPTAGLATYNLFRNMKVVLGMLFILGIIFSIINLYINIKIVIELGAQMTGEIYPILFLNSVQLLNYTIYPTLTIALQVSVFLLLLTVIVWWFAILITTCLSQKYERIVDENYLSASDFSIMLENVPIHYSEDKLKQEFGRYFESLVFTHNIKNTWGEVLKPFTIKKICRTVPFSLNEAEVFDKELEGLDRDILQKKKLLADWVLEMRFNFRFSYSKAEREREYIGYQRMIERRKQKIQDMELKVREQYERANHRLKTTIIVTFEYNQSAQIIQHLNPQTLPAKIRYYLSLCKSTQYFDIRDYISNSESDIVASRAPEPEDIVWGNVAVPLSILVIRKLITWAVMLVLSGILFGIIYGISTAQVNGTGVWSSVFIGFLVAFFNLITKFALRKLSAYEKDFTETDRQRGILLKGLLVLAFNWIIPTVVSNVANENLNIFGLNGLAYEVYYISIFECLLPPLVRIFDPEYFFNVVWGWWKNKPEHKIVLKQGQLNDYIDNADYELGWSYIYFINILFFSCFYINLYPGILIFSLPGVLFMFWAEKYCLLNRSQRPEKIAHSLTGTVETLLSLAPFVLWLGHLIWINAMIQDFSSVIFTGDMILMSVSLLYFITPWQSLHACVSHIPDEELLFFDHCQPKFATDYDKLNPAFIDFGLKNKIELEGKKKDEDIESNLNRSEVNLVEPFDSRYLHAQIAKIPSIFGRKNEVSKKFEREDTLKPRNMKGEDIQSMLMPPNREGSAVKQEHVKVRVNSKQSSSPEMNRHDTEEVLPKNKEDSPQLSHEDTQKKVMVNVSSSGNVFGRKKDFNSKRKSISVVDRPEDYEYDRRAQK